MKYEQFLPMFDRIFRAAQDVFTDYQNRLNECTEQTDANTARKEYARGGLGFGLGCYSANPMEEHVIGGVHLGRLLKRVQAAKKPDWEYCFDFSNQLIAAHENFAGQGDIHFIIRNRDEFVWDIVYDSFDRLGRISVYYFEHNRLEAEVRFSAYSFGREEDILSQVMYNVWIFDYQEDGFIEFEHFSELLYPDRAKQFLERLHLDWHKVRTVYRKHPEQPEDGIRYDHFELDETTGENRFFTTRTILKSSMEPARVRITG